VTDPTPAWLIAWTVAGDLALVDAQTGHVVSTSAGAGMGGTLDATVDVDADRVVTFEGDEESTWGEVATYALDRSTTPPSLGPRVVSALIDGDARVAAAPEGILVFSYGAATEWTILRDDNQVTLSAAGGRPWSVVTRASEKKRWLTALAYDEAEDALSLRHATLDAGALVLGANTPLALNPNSTPRLARIAAQDREAVISVEQGELSLRCLTNEALGVPTALSSFGAARVEATLGLKDSGKLAILTSGPARVLVVELNDDCSVADVAGLDLAPVRVEDRFFSRDLVEVNPDRLIVATEAGAVAITIATTPKLTLALDPTFDGADLRGALVNVTP
jgi:hypothetical protein